VIEHIPAVLRDEQIGVPIVIVIAPHATQPETSTRNSGFVRHVGKCAVAVVVIQRILHLDSTVVEIARVDEVNILPAVVIVIGHANAGAKFLQIDRSAVIALKMREVNAGSLGDVGKLDGLLLCGSALRPEEKSDQADATKEWVS
jgi:hypothetical protein